MSLYTRISNINNDSKIQFVFNQKIKDISEYQTYLLQNKTCIEVEIDNYWEFIVKNVDKNAEEAVL